MSKLIALIAILATVVLIEVGKYWYVFGIWPRSWWALFGFTIANLCVYGLLELVKRDE